MDNVANLDELRKTAQDDVRAARNEITALSNAEIGLILTNARSHYAWQDKPVTNEMLHKIFDITIMGPTSMNTCPARIVFVKSDDDAMPSFFLPPSPA